MSFLNIGKMKDANKFRNKRKTVLFSFAFLAAVLTLGTTFTSNISLNDGSSIEFGQGVAQYSACDPEFVLTPLSSFVDGPPAEFKFSGLKLTEVDTTDQSNSTDGCAHKSFLFTLYNQFDEAVTPTITLNIEANGSFSSEDGNVATFDTATTQSSAVFSFVNPTISAMDIKRFTFQSSDGLWRIGDTGPGGGVVVFDAGSKQTWGRYIEVAPTTWNGSTGDAVTVIWCSNNVLDVNSDSTGIGTGKTNTDRMVGSNCSSGVGIKARNYRGGGKADWSVPSIAEMQLIFNHTNLVLGLENTGNGYWTSNGATGDYRWVGNVVVNNGGIGGVNKEQTGPALRPIRLF